MQSFGRIVESALVESPRVRFEEMKETEKKQRKRARSLENLQMFPKGTSGNPKGRPKGSRNRSTRLRYWLETEVDIKNPITKVSERGTVEDLVTLALITKAQKGDVAAIREVLDTVYGKMKDTTEQTGSLIIEIHRVEDNQT